MYRIKVRAMTKRNCIDTPKIEEHIVQCTEHEYDYIKSTMMHGERDDGWCDNYSETSGCSACPIKRYLDDKHEDDEFYSSDCGTVFYQSENTHWLMPIKKGVKYV